jgi:hypothetical protein
VPNWCSNDLYIYGKGRQQIAEAIAGENGVIDFDKIIPMPAILKGTTKGSEESEAAILLGWDNGLTMLGWEWVQQYGIKTVEELKAYLLKNNPELPKVAAKLKQAREETGFSNWYDWSIETWGTKWIAHDGVREDHRTRIMLTFETAWSPPMPIVKALSEKYPKNKFSFRYYECGVGFKGHFAVKGGVTIADESSNNYRGRRGG